MAEQVGKFLTELPELETPTDGDLMYIVDDETTSKKVTMANLKRVLGGNVTGTVEGASVSFSDGADGIPMEECEVTLVPSQDLHGYSKPWAGGANFNKFNEDTELGGLAWATGQPVAGNDRIRSATYSAVEPSMTYYLYADGEFTGSIFAFYYQSDYTFISYEEKKNTTLTTPSNAYYIKLVILDETSYTSGIALNKPSSETNYTPYSNICPISGHSSVTVTVASTSGGSGEDTTVSLGRTVYGGTLDVTTGELTVTHGRVDLGSLSWSLVGSGNSERFQANGLTDNLLPPNNSTPFSGLCEIYEVARWDYLESAGHDIFICNNSTAHWLAVRDTNYTSATDFTNSVNGKYLVYELATPQTFNLTPTQVKTLLGQNYVSHDGGGNIKVVYIRDLDIVINDLIDRVTALENE